jgi:ApeA N-terminal domain 1
VDSFDYEGIFWPAGHPDQRVAGRLSYKPTEGSSLDLIGSFDDPVTAFNSSSPVRRIHGVAGAKDLTLDGCIRQTTSLQGPGIIRQEYYVPVVLAGAHLAADDPTEFDSITLQFDQLPFWIDRSSFSVSFDTNEPHNLSTTTKVSIAFEVPEQESASTGEIEVVLSSIWSVGGNRVTEMHVSRAPTLTLRYYQRRSLDDIIVDINGIQDLITLAMDAPAVPALIQLRRSDITVQASSGSEIEIPMDAYWLIFAEHVREAKPTGNAKFFSFDQVGGVSAIVKWVSVSRQYRLVLGLLLTIRYSQRLYEENRFTNVISAAETFHRMRFANEIMPSSEFRSYKRKIANVVRISLGRRARDWLNKQLQFSNEPRLRDRLIEVANYAGQDFVSFVNNDVELWSRIVTLLRNRLTHHDPSQAIERKPGDLRDATESIYVMTMLALLRECEVPEVVFTGFQDSARIRFIKHELEDMIPRLAQHIHG